MKNEIYECPAHQWIHVPPKSNHPEIVSLPDFAKPDYTCSNCNAAGVTCPACSGTGKQHAEGPIECVRCLGKKVVEPHTLIGDGGVC
jgi:hypothetical protein